jgi:hypothetical protein
MLIVHAYPINGDNLIAKRRHGESDIGSLQTVDTPTLAPYEQEDISRALLVVVTHR